VSKTIAQLEERLGVHLLLRSNRSLTPTLAGQHFYERAKRVVADANEAELVARGVGATLNGRLRVSASVTFSRMHVIPHLPIFFEKYPEIDVEILMEDRAVNLVEEGVDIALRIGPLNDSALTARKIGQCQRSVLGTPAYFERAGVPTTPCDLTTHSAILLTLPSLSSVWNFRQGTVETSVTLQGRFRSTAAEGLRAAVLAGIGLAVCPDWLFAEELKQGTVVRVLRDWDLPAVDLWALSPAGRRGCAKARAFVQFIEELVSNGSIPDASLPGCIAWDSCKENK
jgi:DNA-binding transcriptional LysR family regulator